MAVFFLSSAERSEKGLMAASFQSAGGFQPDRRCTSRTLGLDETGSWLYAGACVWDTVESQRMRHVEFIGRLAVWMNQKAGASRVETD